MATEPNDPHSSGTWQARPVRQRKRLVTGIYVQRPQTDQIATCIDEIRGNRAYLTEPTVLLLTGDTGLGKSTFLKKYAKKSRRRRVAGRVKQPIIYMEMPTQATPLAAAELLLKLLGDPRSERGRLSSREFRIVELLKAERVEIVLIDEFQHIIEASGASRLNAVANLIKQVVKQAGVPLLLCGMPEVKAIVEGHPQLAGICDLRFEMEAFSHDTDAGRLALRIFLRDYDRHLPFDQLSRLGSPDIAEALGCASGGNMRRLIRLLWRAAFRAIERGAPSIQTEDLEEAFARVMHTYNQRTNVFTTLRKHDG